MKKPKILYHGSSKKIEKLIPRKPGQDIPINSMKAVFATDRKNFAISMGLSKSKYSSSFSGNNKLHFVRGSPKMKFVYLYYLSPKTFKLNRKNEYVSYEEVIPLKIEKLKVSDLGHLWRKSNRKELTEFLKDRDKWRKENKKL